ncbi:MAG: polysaccharide biosynthesis protein [Pseudolysinimonas sp.]|uniref:lipopolysaccharide biosynthesis protein n=1 Tax=Pseudolysinimonas sp. TaxID=2680009 RepID=UPI0032633580
MRDDGAQPADGDLDHRRSENGGFMRRVVAFAGLPFLSLVTPFLFLPLLSRLAGADSWLAIAVGQSAGAFAALFISLGYNTVGPTMVARAQPGDRADVLRESLPVRLVMFLPFTAAAVVVASMVAPPGHVLESALMTVALAVSGLSAAWYMVGVGKAGLLVRYEIAPRMVATLAAAALLVTTGVVFWYPLLLIVASLVSTAIFTVRTIGGLRDHRGARGEVGRMLRRNGSAMAIEVAGGAYNALAVTFVSAMATVAQAATYVSGDKFYRMSQYAASALGNAAQGWVVEAGHARFPPRARLAVLAHLGLGVMGFVAFATLGPLLTSLLFGPAVAIDEFTALGFGVATLGIAVGTALGRVILVALGARRDFLVCVILGATAGVPAILVLAGLFGAAGGAWGLAIGEMVSVTAQTIFVIRRWSRATTV